jgi:4-amino-4-deoxy-L-arabinose transferase-like glycosyltransferase
MNRILKQYLPVLLLFILLSCILLMCAVPPVSRDALTHHLFVPKLYVQFGGIREIPEIVCSYYPQLIDLLYCIPLVFGNDIVPKFIHFSFGLFTAFLLFQHIKKHTGSFYAWFGVLFFLSIPVIVKLSVTVYVDLGLIFFSTASLLLLLKWHEKKYQIFWLLLSAIMCGFALSTKYNGLITFFLLTLFVPVFYLQGKKKDLSVQLKAGGYGFIFFIIAIFIFSPWMIKNYKWVQNPIYPLYENYFNKPDKPDLIQTQTKPQMNHFLVRKFVFKEKWWETILIPIRIFFQGEDDNPKFFDGKLNPFLLFLPFFAFINKPSKLPSETFEKKSLITFSFLYILIVYFRQDMRIRWIAPAIPPLIILSTYGLKNILDNLAVIKFKNSTITHIKTLNIPIVFTTIFFLLLPNFIYLFTLFKHVDPLTYLSGQISRSAYIEKFRPEISVIEFSNHNSNDSSKLLGLFLGNRGYYFENVIHFDADILKTIVQQSYSSEEIHSSLRQHNFTDLIINHEKLNSWIALNFNNDEKKKIRFFFNHFVILLFQKNGVGLYHLK